MAEFNGSQFPLKEEGKSSVVAAANILRPRMMGTNLYSPSDPYSEAHPNAVADGDEKGRNEIGNIIDIEARNRMLGTNKYSANRPYRLDE
jgi:hypothetical protein